MESRKGRAIASKGLRSGLFSQSTGQGAEVSLSRNLFMGEITTEEGNISNRRDRHKEKEDLWQRDKSEVTMDGDGVLQSEGDGSTIPGWSERRKEQCGRVKCREGRTAKVNQR